MIITRPRTAGSTDVRLERCLSRPTSISHWLSLLDCKVLSRPTFAHAERSLGEAGAVPTAERGAL
jgi:hypothetical protein